VGGAQAQDKGRNVKRKTADRFPDPPLIFLNPEGDGI
jgi:hypothetical protein